MLHLSCRNIDSGGPIVPPKFTALLKTLLARMVGLEKIPHDYVDHKFWTRWPTKFRERARYTSNKTKADRCPQIHSRKRPHDEERRIEKKVIYIYIYRDIDIYI